MIVSLIILFVGKYYKFFIIFCQCVSPNRLQDIIRMWEMPLLAIEIVSPKQSVFDITEKFKIFFELGVKSCWLVEPITGIITVFSSPDRAKTFTTGEVGDEVLDIRLPIGDIFD